MRLRIIDYVANPGGGIKFSSELIKSILSLDNSFNITIVSCGEALENYRLYFEENNICVEFIEIYPLKYWKRKSKRFFNIPYTTRIMNFLGFGSRWHIPIPQEAFKNCDAVILPWLHQHRIPSNLSVKIIGSFHDAISFMFEGILSPKFLKEEFYSYQSWVSNKNLKIVVSSNSTIKTIRDLFNTPENRFELIPVSGEHYKFDTYKENQFYQWQSQEYYFCPANTSPHKNHEILFNGYKLSNFKYPLVISGTGTLLRPECGRSQVLLELLKKNNLNIGIDILNLGYIDDECYYSLLSKCRVLIMPTKAEGGGSFPICEAMQLGIPVICSNIPVILEQLERIGGEVILCDVNNPTSLSNAIIELENNYSFYKKRAIDQIRFLKSRTWEEVAKEYVRLI